MRLRKAVLEDAQAIAELASQLGYPTTGQQAGDRLSAILDLRDQQVLVACAADGAMMGWIHALIARRIESGPFVELGGLIVAEKYRRRGVGAALLAAAEEWAGQHGILKIRVRSRVTRSDAHGFYLRWGFTKSKEQYVYDKPIDR